MSWWNLATLLHHQRTSESLCQELVALRAWKHHWNGFCHLHSKNFEASQQPSIPDVDLSIRNVVISSSASCNCRSFLMYSIVNALATLVQKLPDIWTGWWHFISFTVWLAAQNMADTVAQSIHWAIRFQSQQPMNCRLSSSISRARSRTISPAFVVISVIALKV
jgi:hypothetical protein